MRPHKSRLYKSMLAQLRCNNYSIWYGRLHDNNIYFVLLIAVVLLLVKFLQVCDSLWLSQNHKMNVGLIMQRFRSLVSKKVLISLLWGLGLVSDGKMNVSVSWKCGKVSVLVSSWTEKQTSRSRTTRSRLHHWWNHNMLFSRSLWPQPASQGMCTSKTIAHKEN